MQEEVVKLHKDWIQELYYRELVGLTTKEKTHDRYRRTVKKVKTNPEGNRRVPDWIKR